jgi:hypothetical protein
MFRLFKPIILILAAFSAIGNSPARAETPLTPEIMQAGLRTADPDQQAYITYIGTLLQQGRLPEDLVTGTYRWAQKKPAPLRAQSFIQAMIVRAAELGITLPSVAPALTGTIQGRVVVRLLLVDVPVPNATVVIDELNRSATANLNGQFTFQNVPFGTYTLQAKGLVSLILRKGTVHVQLPSPPPSTEPITANITLK